LPKGTATPSGGTISSKRLVGRSGSSGMYLREAHLTSSRGMAIKCPLFRIRKDTASIRESTTPAPAQVDNRKRVREWEAWSLQDLAGQLSVLSPGMPWATRILTTVCSSPPSITSALCRNLSFATQTDGTPADEHCVYRSTRCTNRRSTVRSTITDRRISCCSATRRAAARV
jgi:hypothetical protein